MAQLPPYTSTGERIWHYTFRVICGLVFMFLMLPILVVLPLSFNVSPYFSFTEGMLAFDPEDRITIQEILTHPWLTKTLERDLSEMQILEYMKQLNKLLPSQKNDENLRMSHQ